MNKPRLLSLAKYILRHPDQYDQKFWMYGKKSEVVERQKPPCGTAGCIAGNYAIQRGLVRPVACTTSLYNSVLDGFYKAKFKNGRKVYDVQYFATEGLGLTSAQADRLFDSNFDAGKFDYRYNEAKTPKGRARVAHDWILHNIKLIEKEERVKAAS